MKTSRRSNPNRTQNVQFKSRTIDALEQRVLLATLHPVPDPTSGEYPVSSAMKSSVKAPDSAMDGSGNSVVLWPDTNTSGTCGLRRGRIIRNCPARLIAGQFDADGSLTNRIIVSNLSGDYEVSMDGGGKFLVSNRYHGVDFSLHWFNRDGSLVAQKAFGNEWVQTKGNIRTSLDGNGVATITWNEGYDIYLAKYSPSGETLLAATRVNSFTPDRQERPDIGVDAQGNSVIVWQSRNNHDDLNGGVYGQRFDATGNPVGGNFRINVETADIQHDPQVAVSPTGNFVVMFGTSRGTWFRGQKAVTYSQEGDRQSNEVLITQKLRSGDIGMESSGNWFVTWDQYGSFETDYDVRAIIFDPSGSILDSMIVNTTIPRRQQLPSIAVGPHGDYFVTWVGYGQDLGDDIFQSKIYGRLYKAEPSIGGEVFDDLNGNGVRDDFEPGIADRTVYIDQNENNEQDEGEPSSTTNSGGSFRFFGLADGDYSVRQIIPSPWVVSQGAEFTITVVGGISDVEARFGTFLNHEPEIASIPNQRLAIQDDLSYSVQASDPNRHQTLQYNLLGGPSGMEIDSTSGEITWEGDRNIGTHRVTVSATDDGNPARSSTQSFDLTVYQRVSIVEMRLHTNRTGAKVRAIDLVLDGEVDRDSFRAPGALTVQSDQREFRVRRLRYIPRLRAIRIAAGLNLNRQDELIRINANGLVNTDGMHIDGNGDGDAGGTFEGTIRYGTELVYRDRDNDKVFLGIRNEGRLVLVDSQTSGTNLYAYGSRRDRSVLVGNVRRSADGDGQEKLDSINILDNVRNRLSRRKFI